MAEGKKGFVLYTDLIHTVRKMPRELQGDLFMTILEYVNDENPEPTDLTIDLVFEGIKQQLKRDLKKYEARADRARQNGSKGGRPKNPKKPSGLQKNPVEPKKPDTVNDKVTVIDKVTDTDINDDDVLISIEKCKEKYLSDERLKKAIKENLNIPDLETRLTDFNKHLETQSEYSKKWSDYTSHFINWHKKNKIIKNNNSPTSNLVF